MACNAEPTAIMRISSTKSPPRQVAPMEPTTGLRGLIDPDLAERPKSDSAGKPPADRPDTDFVDEIVLLCHPITFIDESVNVEL